MKKNVLLVVGTRPNFIKVTQFKNAVSKHYPNLLDVKIVHTGQHFDHKMADVFFQQLDMVPDFFLEIPAASANTQMGEIMIRLGKVINSFKPALLMVVGDVNSTFAAALTANKLGIKVAHIESGLRSFDREMPEEINRILTDEISDYYFVTEESGLQNLAKEGRPKETVFFVGNTMIDTLVAFEDKIKGASVLSDLDLEPKKFILLTMHRPSNVDHEEGLLKLMMLLERINQEEMKVIFPIHPRTVKKLKEFDLFQKVEMNPVVILSEPLDYFAFQKLVANCLLVITDSGGIQEETTFKRVPCITLRDNTERPSTTDIGSNKLMAFDVEEVMKEVQNIKGGGFKKGQIPPFWDGKATERIVEIISKLV
jgi:UDP-N-acetylglucosamine 2-epimerase (non-hydrolysing)